MTEPDGKTDRGMAVLLLGLHFGRQFEPPFAPKVETAIQSLTLKLKKHREARK